MKVMNTMNMTNTMNLDPKKEEREVTKTMEEKNLMLWTQSTTLCISSQKDQIDLNTYQLIQDITEILIRTTVLLLAVSRMMRVLTTTRSRSTVKLSQNISTTSPRIQVSIIPYQCIMTSSRWRAMKKTLLTLYTL